LLNAVRRKKSKVCGRSLAWQLGTNTDSMCKAAAAAAVLGCVDCVGCTATLLAMLLAQARPSICILLAACMADSRPNDATRQLACRHQSNHWFPSLSCRYSS
jgi:hypothetical protein